MRDWNDLRLVLAIGRNGTLKGAAADLGHTHSTLFRWLNSLEERTGARLFERKGGHYTPTAAGERVVAAAERVELETVTLDREISGIDARLSGSLRATSSETIAYRILNSVLAEFHRAHPGIEIELIVDNRQLDLARREADVAIRATRPTDGNLFGGKIANVAWTLYGSRDYVLAHGPVLSLKNCEHHKFVGWDLAATAGASKWLNEAVRRDSIIYRSSSLINQLMAAKAGIGLALLPCYLGDLEPDIERVVSPIKELSRELWLVTHQDSRQTARIKAFFDIVGAGLRARRPLLEGRQAGE